MTPDVLFASCRPRQQFSGKSTSRGASRTSNSTRRRRGEVLVKIAGVGHVPLRRAPTSPATSPVAHAADAVDRRPRGCRRRAWRSARASSGSSRATTSSSASSRPAAAAQLRVRPLEPVRPRRRTFTDGHADRRRHRTSPHHRRARPRSRCACSARSPTTPSSTRRAASRSTRTGRSTGPACSAAASSPAGARRCTPPRSARATSSPSSAVGGIGSNAIQGAKLAGARVIAAIDPVEFKREKAMEFGATHTFASIAEAHGGARRRHLGPWLRQGHHDHGRRRRRAARRGVPPRRQAREDRRHQHPPDRGGRRSQVPAIVPDADGEAARRLAVRLGEHPQGHPAAARAVHRRASSTSTTWSPRPTPSTRSTRATRTCATARTSAASSIYD